MSPSTASHPVRVNERLLSYWQSIKPASGLPLEPQVEPADITDIWDSCFLLKVDADKPNSYTYAMLGRSLIEAYGDDWTNKSVCEALLYPHPEPLFKAFEQVVEGSEPLIEDNVFTNPSGMVVKYRSCLVPLARENGGKVAYILGAMKWKAY